VQSSTHSNVVGVELDDDLAVGIHLDASRSVSAHVSLVGGRREVPFSTVASLERQRFPLARVHDRVSSAPTPS